MMRFLFLSFSLLLAFAGSAMAQSEAELKACIDRAGGVSTEMLACGKTQIDKWDVRLNAAYKALLRRDGRAERTRLQREQRAWLKHHLAETARLAADPDNGSVAFLDSQSFELDDLSKRTLELEARVHRDR